MPLLSADMKGLRLRAWSEREAGRTFSLEELVGPALVRPPRVPGVRSGRALVDYILRQFGPERFVELYATRHPATFAADCQRILGVSIDQLDQDYWADLDKHVGPGGYHRALARLAAAWPGR